MSSDCRAAYPFPVRGVVLRSGDVRLREIRLRDGNAWRRVRARNAEWLMPWEATVPDPDREPLPSFHEMVRRLRAEARVGRTLPFVVEHMVGDAASLVGQVTVASITYGSMRGASIGYWVDRAYAGRGIIPTAVALSTDYCFGTLGLHRIEIAIRPENGPSLSVVRKLGFRSEGVRERYLHINGSWRDHAIFAITPEEVPEGMLARWNARHAEML